MARYGQAFKDKAGARLLPPESAPVEVVSREVSVGAGTLERWREDAQSRPARGRAWTVGARLEAVITTAAMNEASKSAWCREPGVYPAYFSDRGRLFQADRGRQFDVAVAALGKRAGTGADNDRLPVLLEAMKATLRDDAKRVLADAGFRSESVFEQLKDSPSELIVALGREGKQALEIDAQKYPLSAAMDAKLKTPEGKAAYRKRKWIVEAPNGWIKSVLGFRQFSLRGLDKVKAEFKLACHLRQTGHRGPRNGAFSPARVRRTEHAKQRKRSNRPRHRAVALKSARETFCCAVS